MNRTRATLLLIAVSLTSLGATGCHRHRQARMYPVMAPMPQQEAYVERPAYGRPQPLTIIIETRGSAAPVETYAPDTTARDEAAAEEEAARRAQIEQARIAHEQAERARIAHEQAERARLEREQAARDAQARAAAANRGTTTVIVLTPSGARVVDPAQANGWFEAH